MRLLNYCDRIFGYYRTLLQVANVEEKEDDRHAAEGLVALEKAEGDLTIVRTIIVCCVVV